MILTWKFSPMSALALTALFCLCLGVFGCASPPSDDAAHAKKLIDRGDLNGASGMLDRILKKKPDDASALVERGRLRELYDQYGLAQADYSKAIEAEQDNAGAWEARGRLFAKLRKYDRAIDDLKQAAKLRADPSSTVSLIGLMEFYRGDLATARARFDEATARNPEEEGAYFGRTAIHIERSEYPAAIREMTRLIDRKPKNAEAFLRRGFAFLSDNHPGKAVEDFNRALKLDPKMSSIYWYRADAYRALSDLEMALKDYERAGSFHPTDSILFLNQGVVLMMMGKYQQALEKLSRSIVLDPDNLLPYINRARLHLRTGNYLASLRDLNRALSISPDNPWLLVKRAFIFKVIGRGDRALRDLDKAVKSNLKDREALLLRGSLYFNESQLQRAIGDLKQAIVLAPEDPSGPHLLAEALLTKGDTAGAMEQAAAALRVEPMYAPAYVTMGDIHKADSQVDRAVEAYSRALTIDPNHFIARLRRAGIYMELGKNRLALDDLIQAGKINPYSGQVYELRARCYEIMGDKEKAAADHWKARVFAHRR